MHLQFEYVSMLDLIEKYIAWIKLENSEPVVELWGKWRETLPNWEIIHDFEDDISEPVLYCTPSAVCLTINGKQRWVEGIAGVSSFTMKTKR